LILRFKKQYLTMKNKITKAWILIACAALPCFSVVAQCSMCTKTAQQLGEKPAEGLNSAILYLMLAPFAIVGFIAYRWWKNNKEA
jgi:cell division protein FtsW (lipid II flippase)